MPARFVLSAAKQQQLPELLLPELAVVGRSNVGKSTLCGCLLKAPRLVRTSKTPGRTQLLNLFIVDDTWALVDLPGYGFSKIPKSEQRAMQDRLYDYIFHRPSLTLMLLLLDIRRTEPSVDDMAMISWLMSAGREMQLVCTKSDALPKNQLLNRKRSFEKIIGLPPGSIWHCSVKNGDGIKELKQQLFQRLKIL